MTVRRALLTLLLVLALVAAACGNDDDDTASSGESQATEEATSEATAEPDEDATDEATAEATSEATEEATAEATEEATDGAEGASGGTVTIGVFAESQGIDPIVQSGTGLAGGMENIAVYDVLMRWDPETGEYEPHMAESLTPNDDFTEWTLTLRPDVNFSDGTPVTSESVVFSIQRHIDNGSRTASLVTPITGMETPDDTTVVFSFDEPYASFPYALASAPGMIINPAAVEALGEDLPTNPEGAGAGPFVIESFLPNEAVTLSANPDYWGGQPAIDELRFVFVPGADATYENFLSGEFQAAFLRDPAVINRAKEEGSPFYEALYSAGGTILMNNGVRVTCDGGQPAPICEGEEDGAMPRTESIANDPRIRQAVAAAINLDTLNERAYDGAATMTTSLMHEGSQWYSGIEGPQYDPELAMELVEEVKAEGWDGSIRVACHNGSPDFGTTVAAMLDAVGFDTEVRDQRDVQANIAEVLVEKDFDLACWGSTIADEAPFFALIRDMDPDLNGTGGNFAGYESDEVDALLDRANAAGSAEEIQEIIDGLSTAYAEDIPFLSFQPTPDFIIVDADVQGWIPTVSTNLLFHDATYSG